ncbi:MAG: TolC family protein, partial [Wenzhouxiangella sp.]
MYCRGISCSLGLLAGLLLPVAALALPVELAVERALARDAGLQALGERARSLDQSALADSALPDPQLTLGAEGLPISDPFSADMMTMYTLGVRQSFPAGATRRLSGERGSTLARATEIEARARRLEVALQTRVAWLAWAAATESASRIEAMIAQTEALVELTERRYAAGTGRRQDESQARLELVLLERRRLDAATGIDAALARLQRWTGPMESIHHAPRLPDWTRPVLRNADLASRLAAHPDLVAARTRVEAGELGAEIARQAYRPEWMLEAGYGHQRGSDPMGGRMADKLFVMASVSLPLFTANRQDRRVDAALAERDAEEAQAQYILQRLSGELDEQIALRHRLA